MYKNQLQELAQRSCFNLPSYACIRAGPDHAPRFKASVNFNGEVFESPSYSSTLRQAEHAAAEVAINVLSSRGPSRSLTARVLDETGVYKNLLQETAHRAGLNLPVYTTVRSGPGHLPVFTCTVNLAGMNFTGVSAKTKKQAEKNAAIAAWSALKRIPNLGSSSQTNKDEEEDHVLVSRVLSSFKLRDDQSKQVRKWDQSRARRRVFVKGHGDNSFASSSTCNKYLQEMRPIDLLVESSTQNQKSFTSLLPPPPPRTTSRILPPLPTSFTDNLSSLHQSNRPLQDQVSVKSQAKLEEMSEEHQRDEEEWIGGETDIIKKPIELKGPANSHSSTDHCKSSIYRPFPLLNLGKLDNSMSDKSGQDGQTHIVRSRAFGPLTPSSMAASPTKPVHTNRPIYTGGFHHPHRIAPAVQIRSVIPVCAAPPPMRPPPQSSQPSSSLQLHTSPTSSALGPSSSSPVPNQTELDQESSISSILDKLLL